MKNLFVWYVLNESQHLTLSSFLVVDDHTRVVLSEHEGSAGSDYINANYIDVSAQLLRLNLNLVFTHDFLHAHSFRSSMMAHTTVIKITLQKRHVGTGPYSFNSLFPGLSAP